MNRESQKTKSEAETNLPEIETPKIPPALSTEPNIHLEVTQIDQLQEEDLKGDQSTFLAVKTDSTYMIGTETEELKVVNNGKQVFSGRLPEDAQYITAMTYISLLNCVIIHTDYGTYRKDFDDQPPYFFLNVPCAQASKKSSFSSENNRLLVAKRFRGLAVVNMRRRQREIELNQGYYGTIIDFKIFGKRVTKVVCLTWKGDILLYIFNFALKKICAINRAKVDRIVERNEIGLSIEVCEKGEYILVEISDVDEGFCSRIIIFQLKTHIFKKVKIVDLYHQKIGYHDALKYVGYSGKHIYWVGLSCGDSGFAQIFDFDTETGEFTELEEKRIDHQEREPERIIRLGNQFYYVGRNGKVMRLTINI